MTADDINKLSNRIRDYLNTYSFNQAYVKFKEETPILWQIPETSPLYNLIKFELDATGNFKTTDPSGNNLARVLRSDYENTNLSDIMNAKSNNKKDAKSNIRIIFYIHNKTRGNHVGFVKRPTSETTAKDELLRMRYSYLFPCALNDLSAFAHEMGHCYNLTEAFDEKVNISPGSSINIMDYTQLPYMFWRWQAKDINTTIENEK
jgi:hypothetical protein